MESLPPAICCKIALHVGTQADVCRARLVCKAWAQHMSLAIQTMSLNALTAAAAQSGKLHVVFPDIQLAKISKQALGTCASSIQHGCQRPPDCDLCTAASVGQACQFKGMQLQGMALDAVIAPVAVQHTMRCAAPNIRQLRISSVTQHVASIPLLTAVCQHFQSLISLDLPLLTFGPQRRAQNITTLTRLLSASSMQTLRELSASLPGVQETVSVQLPSQHASMAFEIQSANGYDTAQQLAGFLNVLLDISKKSIDNGSSSTATATNEDLTVQIPSTALLLACIPNLRALHIKSQVDLSNAWLAAALGSRTQLIQLRLPSLFVSQPCQLASLSTLTSLRTLDINFRSEWWLHAGDLTVLRPLTQLTQLVIAVDYGLAGDDLEEELRQEAIDKDDWSAALLALPSLVSFQLSLKHAQTGPVLQSLHKADQSITSSHAIRSVALSFIEPMPGHIQLQPACHLITSLELQSKDRGGLALIPQDLLHIASMTNLKQLTLVASLVPDTAAGDLWPSAHTVYNNISNLYERSWHEPLPWATKLCDQTHDSPGNPLTYLANLRRLRSLTLLWHSRVDLTTALWNLHTRMIQRLRSPESNTALWETDNEKLHSGPGRYKETAFENILQDCEYGNEFRDVLTSFQGAARWFGGKGQEVATDAPMEVQVSELCRVFMKLIIHCTGITDSVIIPCITSMKHLTHLHLNGTGWLSGEEDGGLAAIGQHGCLSDLHVQLAGLPAPLPLSESLQQAPPNNTTSSQNVQQSDLGNGQGSQPTVPGSGTLPAAARSRRDSSDIQMQDPSDITAGSSMAGTSFDYLQSYAASRGLASGFHPAHSGAMLEPSSLSMIGHHISLKPSHLPTSLRSLYLADVRFTRNWEEDCQCSTLPRLTSLSLSQNGLIISNSIRAEGGSTDAATAQETSNQHNALIQSPSLIPPATMITNWHFKYVIARQPMLSRLTLVDPLDNVIFLDGRASAQLLGADLPSSCKLKSRAVQLLSGLKHLSHLQLKVGGRMGWQAQEALAATLTRMRTLRSLNLGASNLYDETYGLLTYLTQVTSFEMKPSYQLDEDENRVTMQAVQKAMPWCQVVYS